MIGKKYNPGKPNNRWGLSITSIDGGLHGIPDLTSLADWKSETGEVLKNHDLNVPTPVWEQCPTLKKTFRTLETLAGSMSFS